MRRRSSSLLATLAASRRHGSTAGRGAAAVLLDWAAGASAGESWRSSGSAALVGRNGAGKSRLLAQVEREGVERVSFEQTLRFVERHGAQSVQSVCGGINSAKARALVVRFGLMACWTKDVEALSSGELRKLTLARAMAGEPGLLLLDGAHDGLDPKSRRQLSQLLGSLVRGMPPLLVDLGGRGPGGSGDRVRARVLQVAQRRDELPSNLSSAFRLGPDGLQHDAFSGDLFADEVLGPSLFLQHPLDTGAAAQLFTALDDTGPVAELQGANVRFTQTGEDGKPRDLGGLRDLCLSVRRGELWAVCGPNGAGKSLFTRLLATPGPLDEDRSASHEAMGWDARPDGRGPRIESNEARAVRLFGLDRTSRAARKAVHARVGTVSISGHMRTIHALERLGEAGQSLSARALVASGLHGAACAGSAASEALAAFATPTATRSEGPALSDAEARVDAAAALVGVPGSLLDRPFLTLSVGEQRMVLVARAVVHGPELCILDEAAQGLDALCRTRLLEVVAAIQQFTATIVITHHADEVPEGTTHALELENGALRKAGPVSGADEVRAYIEAEYDP